MIWLKPLSKSDTILYKAIAILLIVFHNFLHNVYPMPGENEFNFNIERIEKLFDFFNSEPLEMINLIFSYFGHFGVQMFIFLSAYGLTKKYLYSWPGDYSFIKERLSKLYPLIFILILFVWFGRGLIKGDLFTLEYFYVLFLKLTMLSNFVPDQALSIIGPWWFLSLIFQFYIIFPFLRKFSDLYGGIGLLCLSIFSLVFVYSMSFITDYNFYYLFIPHIPEFSLGIYLAKQKKVSFPNYALIGFFIIFILSNYYEIFWYFGNISILILMLVIFPTLLYMIRVNQKIKGSFVFLGMISMELFLVHGFLRRPLTDRADQIQHWLVTLGFSILSFIVSVLVAYILYWLRVNNKLDYYSWLFKR